MKNLLLIFPALLIFSCTVQKRKYQNGYYVEWHNKASKKENATVYAAKQNAGNKANKSVATAQPMPQTGQMEDYASAENKLGISELANTKKLLFTPPEDSCDVLVFKDGAEIRGKIIEKTATEIKYKRCDTPDGPTYVSKKSELFVIKHSDGTREVIRVQEEPKKLPDPSDETKTRRKAHINVNGDYKQVHPLAITSLVLGVLGIVFTVFGLYGLTLGISAFGFLFLFALAAAITALVTGIIAKKRIRQGYDIFKGRQLATCGLIMGLVLLSIYAAALIMTVLLIMLLM